MAQIPFLLTRASQQFGGQQAIITPKFCISYHQYENLVRSSSIRLKKAGFKRGDRISFYLSNPFELAVFILACLHSGMSAVPLNTRIPPNQANSFVKMLRCQALIVQEGHPITAGMHEFNLIKSNELISFENLKIDDQRFKTIEDRQPATILFTSGSTGTPKAALHSYGNHYYSALGSNQNIAFQPGDRWLLSLPLYHVGGLAILFRAALGGGTVVIPEDAKDMMKAIQKYQVTHLSLVSTQLYRLLQDSASGKTLFKLKAILLGGSAMPSGLIRQAHALGLPIHTSYGLTEMASQVTTTPPGASLKKLLTSGKVLPYRQIKISENGEILVKGKTRFGGYVEGENLSEPFDAEGWFATGDLGRLDTKGYLSVMGRKDNMFISGGENIQPEEIEAVLLQDPGVLQAVVVPVPDAEFGQRPVAFVEVVGGQKPETNRLKPFLEEHLPRFKIPVAFLPWPETLQKTGIKPSRQSLVKLAIAGGELPGDESPGSAGEAC